MKQYCGETVGNNVFNVGEYWADLKCVLPHSATTTQLLKGSDVVLSQGNSAAYAAGTASHVIQLHSKDDAAAAAEHTGSTCAKHQQCSQSACVLRTAPVCIPWNSMLMLMQLSWH